MKILMADDDCVTRLALKTLLTTRGFDVHTAVDGEEAFRILQRDDAPRLAIVDWMMPRMDGVELCRALRDSGSRQRVHIIMLTGKRGSEDLVAGLDAGADDYMRKPFDIDELHARLRAAQRLIKIQEELRDRAAVDELTGISSRQAIRDVLRRALAHAVRENSSVSIALLDVDRFKNVNDTYGHPIGDMALRGAAALLGPCLRTYDVVGRYGGEEFLIVLPHSTLKAAGEQAERPCKYVRSLLIKSGDQQIAITVSIGIAQYRIHKEDWEALLNRADAALYQAKNSGRDRWAVSED
jgi:two-component system cell cycle response regulator